MVKDDDVLEWPMLFGGRIVPACESYITVDKMDLDGGRLARL